MLGFGQPYGTVRFYLPDPALKSGLLSGRPCGTWLHSLQFRDATEVVPFPVEPLPKSSEGWCAPGSQWRRLAGVASKPDWLLTHNTKHFTAVVAQGTSLRIATPSQFFRETFPASSLIPFLPRPLFSL